MLDLGLRARVRARRLPHCPAAFIARIRVPGFQFRAAFLWIGLRAGRGRPSSAPFGGLLLDTRPMRSAPDTWAEPAGLPQTPALQTNSKRRFRRQPRRRRAPLWWARSPAPSSAACSQRQRCSAPPAPGYGRPTAAPAACGRPSGPWQRRARRESGGSSRLELRAGRARARARQMQLRGSTRRRRTKHGSSTTQRRAGSSLSLSLWRRRPWPTVA